MPKASTASGGRPRLRERASAGSLCGALGRFTNIAVNQLTPRAAVRSYFALGLFVRLAWSLTIATVLAVFLGPSNGILSITLLPVLLPALGGAILGIRMAATRHSAWLATGASNLLLAWAVAVTIAVGLVALFVHSKNGQLDWEYVTGLGKEGLRIILVGAVAGLMGLLVAGRIARLLSRTEAA